MLYLERQQLQDTDRSPSKMRRSRSARAADNANQVHRNSTVRLLIWQVGFDSAADLLPILVALSAGGYRPCFPSDEVCGAVDGALCGMVCWADCCAVCCAACHASYHALTFLGDASIFNLNLSATTTKLRRVSWGMPERPSWFKISSMLTGTVYDFAVLM